MGGWLQPALQLGGAVFGSLLGRRESPVQKATKANLMTQMQRGSRLWGEAETGANQAANYFAPIAGGSRTAALNAMAPEIQGGEDRINAAEQSGGRLLGRGGGATARFDPYAKANMATSSLMKARPGAAMSLFDIAKTRGSWAGENSSAAGSLLDYERKRKEDLAKMGGGFFDTLSKTLPDIIKNRKSGPWGK